MPKDLREISSFDESVAVPGFDVGVPGFRALFLNGVIKVCLPRSKRAYDLTQLKNMIEWFHRDLRLGQTLQIPGLCRKVHHYCGYTFSTSARNSVTSAHWLLLMYPMSLAFWIVYGRLKLHCNAMAGIDTCVHATYTAVIARWRSIFDVRPCIISQIWI